MRNFKNTLYEIIGERIKTKRKEKDLNQEDLSNYLNLNRSSVSNMENGRHQIPLFVLYELSKLLEIDIHDLIPMNSEVEKVLKANEGYSKILKNKDLGKDKKNIENLLNQIGK